MRDHSSSSAVLDRPAAAPAAQLAQSTAPVSALSYPQLRLLAESAVGLGNVAASFFASDGQLKWVHAALPVPEGAVLVPAFDEGKYPDVEEVRLFVHWNAEGSVPGGSGSINAARMETEAGIVRADAVFWADAAVQKFVFPYLASCGGQDAGLKLQQLQRAWNFYRSQARVFALMHVTALPGEIPLSLDSSFRVGYVLHETDPVTQVVTTSVTTMALGEFASRYGGNAAPPSEPTALAEYEQPRISLAPAQYPDYVALRAIAEHAASLTEGTQYFVWVDGQPQEPTSTPPEPAENQVVIPACTPSLPAVRLIPDQVVFQPEADGLQWTLLPHQADAAFWSAGAIQQFMLPYYASVTGFGAPQELTAIIEAWTLNHATSGYGYGPDAPESTPSSLRVSGTEELEGEGTTVYGLVHLPKSEWAELEDPTMGSAAVRNVIEADAPLTGEERKQLERSKELASIHRFSPMHQIGVVHTHAGGVRMLRLSYFSVLYRAKKGN